MAKKEEKEKAAATKAAPGQKTMTVAFQLERETKGAVRYEEINDKGDAIEMSDPSCVIGTLYIRKSVLNGEPPAKLLVTIAPATS